ncbi:thioredoxin-dependent thiol peroxidase [Candidatus Woesearchaeota archaeon]|nr:thioredoxin-dependent thiol peroxidase [Candidatus Woesearchaeota archaeon]
MVTISVGEKVFSFTLPDQDGKMISLSGLRGDWIILYFYPKDNTPGCTIEGQGFSHLREEFERRGAIIVGVSPDSLKSHCNFIKKQGLTITLLSDQKKVVLKKYGVWGKKKFMGREYMGVLRTTILVDRKGIVRFVWGDVNVKGHAQEVLEMLKELQK